MNNPRIQRAEAAYRRAEHLRTVIAKVRADVLLDYGMTQEMQEHMVNTIDMLEKELAECEGVYKVTCPWLLEQFGDDGHDELRARFPGCGWETRIEHATEGTMEIHYPLPEMVDLKAYAPDELPAVMPPLSKGTCQFIRYGNREVTYGLGYAPEIDTLFYWRGWR